VTRTRIILFLVAISAVGACKRGTPEPPPEYEEPPKYEESESEKAKPHWAKKPKDDAGPPKPMSTLFLDLPDAAAD
jgi:hypothetical protein